MAEWQTALGGRGLDQLSPPEVEHVLRELPAERAAYAGLLSDLSGWPDRTPLSRRVPSAREVAQLRRKAGPWRGICLLDDDLALRTAAVLFETIFVLDPLYDAGELLYAAWHDPVVKAEHAARLAEQGALLVRAGPLLRDRSALLAPDHLPGSWDPRPGWRRPAATADAHLHTAWALRTALVLLNWADRLDALIVSTTPAIVEQLPVALGPRATSCPLAVCAPPELADALAVRAGVSERWSPAREACRARSARKLEHAACAISHIPLELPRSAEPWQLLLGDTALPDPALLLRRVLNQQDPNRQPALPPTRLRRRPLCLVAGA